MCKMQVHVFSVVVALVGLCECVHVPQPGAWRLPVSSTSRQYMVLSKWLHAGTAVEISVQPKIGKCLKTSSYVVKWSIEGVGCMDRIEQREFISKKVGPPSPTSLRETWFGLSNFNSTHEGDRVQCSGSQFDPVPFHDFWTIRPSMSAHKWNGGMQVVNVTENNVAAVIPADGQFTIAISVHGTAGADTVAVALRSYLGHLSGRDRVLLYIHLCMLVLYLAGFALVVLAALVFNVTQSVINWLFVTVLLQVLWHGVAYGAFSAVNLRGFSGSVLDAAVIVSGCASGGVSRLFLMLLCAGLGEKRFAAGVQDIGLPVMFASLHAVTDGAESFLIRFLDVELAIACLVFVRSLVDLVIAHRCVCLCVTGTKQHGVTRLNGICSLLKCCAWLVVAWIGVMSAAADHRCNIALWWVRHSFWFLLEFVFLLLVGVTFVREPNPYSGSNSAFLSI